MKFVIFLCYFQNLLTGLFIKSISFCTSSICSIASCYSFSFFSEVEEAHASSGLEAGVGLAFFPGGPSGKEPAYQCRRHETGFDPWVGKIPWRRAWQPIPVFLPGESQGRGSLVGCRLWGRTENRTLLKRLSSSSSSGFSFLSGVSLPR